MRDGTCASTTGTVHPNDFVHQVAASVSALDSSEDSRPVARTSRYHFAAMRRAEDAARGISIRRSTGSIPADELDKAKAAQNSYYLLAAAHRSAAHKRERAENRALAWAAFTEGPAAYIGCAVRSWAYRIRGAVSR